MGGIDLIALSLKAHVMGAIALLPGMSMTQAVMTDANAMALVNVMALLTAPIT